MSSLFDAVVAGDESRIQSLVRAGQDPNECVTNSQYNLQHSPVLVWPAFKGNERVASLLLKSGANPNASDRSGFTPLMAASFTGNAAVVKVLLQHKANCEAKHATTGYTALMYAANAEIENNLTAKDSRRIVKMLLDAKANANAESNQGITPLIFAAQNGSDEIVRLLLRSGANKSIRAPDGKTPAEIARAHGHQSTARLFDSH